MSSDPGEWACATISAWFLENPKRNVQRLIVDHLDFDEMFDALCLLHTRAMMDRPTKHQDRGDPDIPKEKTAAALVGLIERFQNCEFGDFPNFCVSSKDISKIPLASFEHIDNGALGAGLLILKKWLLSWLKRSTSLMGLV